MVALAIIAPPGYAHAYFPFQDSFIYLQLFSLTERLAHDPQPVSAQSNLQTTLNDFCEYETYILTIIFSWGVRIVIIMITVGPLCDPGY